MAYASGKAALQKRLSSYWKLEVGNAIIIPAAMVGLCLTNGEAVAWLLPVAMLPMVALLILGGWYWRAKLAQLHGKSEPLDRVLDKAQRLRSGLLVATLVAVLFCAAAWISDGVSASMGERIAASIAAALALLEYINYYSRQLQHFDHWADFRRLLSGRGFRESQMAQDLRRRSQKG